MTGWDLAVNEAYGENYPDEGDYTRPMEFTPSEHEDESAESGDGVVTVLGKSFALTSGSDGSGMGAALDALFYHPNIAPHVSKHLIMRLVTSNPTPGYLARISSVFNNNGAGVRGDLKAVVRAVLLDDEARYPDSVGDKFGKIKEPIIAFTQLLRAMNTTPLNGWMSEDGSTAVSGVYWFRDPHEHFGQAALRSPSVFNFYTSDYVPNDSYFALRGMVSPEMKILTDQTLQSISNKIFEITHTFEKNRITVVDGESLNNFAATKHAGYEMLMLSNLDAPLAAMRQAAGGDFSNLESLISSNRPYKTASVNAVIDYYDHLLMGGDMDVSLRNALFEFLMNSAESDHNDNFEEARFSIKDTIRMIATSSAYMFQR
jgi:uncharacterized protein (DUF1800 family)